MICCLFQHNHYCSIPRNMCNNILMEAIFTKGFDKIAAAKKERKVFTLGWKAEILPSLIRLALHMESPTHPDKGMRESHLWQELYSVHVCSKDGFRIQDFYSIINLQGCLPFWPLQEYWYFNAVPLTCFHIFTKNILHM